MEKQANKETQLFLKEQIEKLLKKEEMFKDLEQDLKRRENILKEREKEVKSKTLLLG